MKYYDRQEAQQYVRDMTTGHHKDATSNHYVDVAKAVDDIYDGVDHRVSYLKDMINDLLETDRQRIEYRNFIGYFKDEGTISEERYNKIIAKVEGTDDK